MHLQLNLNEVDRETALRTWLTYHKLGNLELARRLDVDPSFVTYIVQGKRISRRVIDKMIDMGIPEELLPDTPPPETNHK
ncbi:hypothetical protein [Desulfovibrio inopinatus]|uniref:hypothetical protein n=1 Tax=Desulfovibrio inopinatus TaxID=102109 RepID=UPI00041FA838|nr:hypothetical protein [Desulfovibrio inopinatus]